jgi:Mn-containing catalase
MLQDTGANELSHFNLNGRVLGEFLNGCSSEYMAIKNHLLKVTMSELEEDKKDASFFLKRKFDSINASFGKWLKVKTEVINEN